MLLISSEERSKKPYALPIQCVPYKGLSDNKVRELANHVIHEMVIRGMKVAGKNSNVLILYRVVNFYATGFTKDGEWNSLRSMGNTRPLSVFQI